MSLSIPTSEDNRYDEICRMIGDVSIRFQSFDYEICIYAKKHGYNASNNKSREYEKIFGKDDNITIIKGLTDKRNAFIHEVNPIVYGGFSEDYLNKSYDDIKKLYDDYIEFYKEHCEPLLVFIDEGWYQKSSEEIKELEEIQEKAWIDFMRLNT